MAITSCWRSQSCSVVSSKGLLMDRPALLTTRSTPPNARTAAANAVGDLVGVGDVRGDRDRDVGGVKRLGLGGDLLATVFAAAASRSATITHAPSAASR